MSSVLGNIIISIGQSNQRPAFGAVDGRFPVSNFNSFAEFSPCVFCGCTDQLCRENRCLVDGQVWMLGPHVVSPRCVGLLVSGWKVVFSDSLSDFPVGLSFIAVVTDVTLE